MTPPNRRTASGRSRKRSPSRTWTYTEVQAANRNAVTLWVALLSIAKARRTGRQIRTIRPYLRSLTGFCPETITEALGVLHKARWVNRAVGAAYTPPRKWYRLTLLVQGVPELGEPGPRAGSGSAGSRYTGAGRSAESGPSGLSAAERDRRGRFKGNAPLSGSRPAIPPMGERSAAARAPGPAATDAAANSETEQTPLEKKKMREQVERDFAAIPRERLPDVWRLAKDAPSRILLTLERVHTPRDAADRFQWRHAAVWAWGEIQRSEENANSGSKEEMI